jgi:hypothetical protein
MYPRSVIKQTVVIIEICNYRNLHMKLYPAFFCHGLVLTVEDFVGNHQYGLRRNESTARQLFSIGKEHENYLDYNFFLAQQPLVGQGVLIIEISRSLSETPHSVGLIWTSDQRYLPDNYATLTTERHPCPRRDSNPQSQQASGGRPTP